MSARATILSGAFLLSLAALAAADERKFTYSYEAKTLPQGAWEFEQWATLRAHREEGRAWFVDLREELEYGITDRFTAALYLNTEIESFHDVPGEENETEFEFESVSVELKYKLTDPSTDIVGLLAYMELAVGPDEMELELKAVLSKHVGDFTFAYNFIVEFEREKEDLPGGGHEWEKESKIENTFGASYSFSAKWAAGVELVIRTPFEGTFEESEETSVLFGPNVHYAAEAWWITFTFLVQPGEPKEGSEKYEARVIFGINF